LDPAGCAGNRGSRDGHGRVVTIPAHSLTLSFGVAVLVTVAGVSLVRTWALRHAVLDHPNARSSHAVAVPRGGGLAVAACLACGLLSFGLQRSSISLLLAAGAIALIGAVGWIDDRHSLPVGPRLIAHIIAGAALLPLALPPGLRGALATAALACAMVVWSVAAINVVNFIDGIDGMIGSQALVYGGFVMVEATHGSTAQLVGAMLAGSAVGFLFWNWPPARIFLGDAGSGAVGLGFVASGVLLMRDRPMSAVVAFAPLYPIFLDALSTLIARARRGERLTEAHRSHLYQRLANGGAGHARTTIGFALASMAGAEAAATSPTILAGYFALGPVCYYALNQRLAQRSFLGGDQHGRQ
jgi:UDP-N-acetylmuramyl pentapeptide phosphotransferase/UDP-N-acetylglucosamine-1-phosphate transferase